MPNQSAMYEFINKEWEENIIPNLCEFIKIPNKSPHFDIDWHQHGHMNKAAEHLAAWCRANSVEGMKLDVLRLEGRTPLILIDIPGQSNDTVLLYGHMDKQPEMEGWHDGLGPWSPVLKEGRLYGRGSADDGYAVYSALTAIRALKTHHLSHDRCVIIIEGSEESGSCDLPHYIKQFRDIIGEPKLVICLDSGAGNYEQLWITTSLRGNVVGELSAALISEGVHSGSASGIVADSFRVIRQLISRLENQETGEIILDELYCEIPPQRVNEAAKCAEVLGDAVFTAFPLHEGVKPLDSDCQQLILNRTWRPYLAVTGANGLPPVADAGNVLRPYTSVKLSMRLPPLVDAEKAAQVMQKVLTGDPPYQAKISFHITDSAEGWHAPLMAKWLQKAIFDSSMKYFNKPPVYMGEGGTIPFMAMLGKQFPKAQFMITGVLGPHSNAHGPNEFLHLDMAKKITACISDVLHQQFLHKDLE
ncbi:M20 family metallopeptidase [Legionella londiniensis]|uniref:Succinyl-diaminopimelate desuccinylase n=1 Tax=Legionella londiniensis TaxID=45068 RepID=A0A0W0VR05_9GAMM|nr:M20 family metallopeptidase [Legionella londiniensis]KTD22381.1 succinyl-diaminopimelate desuccinylase [Legionella londiniensis]STX93045.1 succinyl-diaminopimelate desuccinylase [Legionella londiniensis]